MEYTPYRSQYTIAQIEGCIGKSPRINGTTHEWEIWDITTSAYVSTGLVAESAAAAEAAEAAQAAAETAQGLAETAATSAQAAAAQISGITGAAVGEALVIKTVSGGVPTSLDAVKRVRVVRYVNSNSAAGVYSATADAISANDPLVVFDESLSGGLDYIPCFFAGRELRVGSITYHYFGWTRDKQLRHITVTHNTTTNASVIAAETIPVFPRSGTITLSTTWSGSGPYTQVVTVTGATVTANSKVDLQPTADQVLAMQDARVSTLTIRNDNGTLTAVASGKGTPPAMTIQCSIQEQN